MKIFRKKVKVGSKILYFKTMQKSLTPSKIKGYSDFFFITIKRRDYSTEEFTKAKEIEGADFKKKFKNLFIVFIVLGSSS